MINKRENYKDKRRFKHIPLKPLLLLLRGAIGLDNKIALEIIDEIELRLD